MKACQRNVGRLFIKIHKKFKIYRKDFTPEFRIYNRKVVKKMSKYKILAITIAAVLTASLTACGKAETDNGISPIIQTASAETVTENTSVFAVPETASAAAETTLTESNELDEETAEMLRREFAEYIGEIDPSYAHFDPAYVRIDMYYGKFNGCEVFLPLYKLGYDDAIEYYYVAGYGIFFSCLGYDIYVHKDGTFYELSDAYEKGYISEEDVAKIAEIQNGMPPQKTDPPETNGIGSKDRENAKLRREEANELRRKFVEFIREAKSEYAELEPSEVGFEAYYGTFDGWEAFLPLYKMNKTGYAAMYEYITIAGYELYFPCLGYEIYVHKDGEFYELSEAYENGYIGEDAVAAIAECNNARYFFAFQ